MVQNWKTWVVTIAVGSFVGVLDSMQAYLLFVALGEPLPWNRVLVTNVTYWATLAACVPFVFWLTSRFGLKRPLRRRNVLIHAVASTSFAVVHNGLYAFVNPLRPRTPGALGAWYLKIVRDYAAAEFVTYWMIVGAFYAVYYYRESRQREIAAAQLQATLTEARLLALRSQLNPHFLFNTLNTISVLALKGDCDAVVDMLTRLSELLRMSLDDRPQQEVPLRQEVQFLRGYLNIQQIRFADRLTVRDEVADDTLDALVPSMIMQPLVENAVVHGIARQRGPGTVTIHSTRADDSLCLRVSDTGRGFDDALSSGTAGGIGLANTRARLEQLYGTHHQFEFAYSAQTGATVTMKIPFRTSRATA